MGNHPGDPVRSDVETPGGDMRLNLKAVFLASIAVASGLVVLLGYFVALPMLVNVRVAFLRWAAVLTGFALLIGVANLLQVHWRKIMDKQPGAVSSAILLAAFVLTLAVAGFFGPGSAAASWLFRYIQLPVETSLLAILAVTLAFAIARLPYRRLTLVTFVFVATVLFTLVSAISIPGLEFPLLQQARSWLIHVVALGGGRGILLGIALGMIATGLRVLISADRPYGG